MPSIRPASDGDGPGIAGLIAEIFAEYEGCPFVAAEFPELVAPASYYAARGGLLWVVEDDDAIAGSLAVFPVDGGPVFELGKVYLDRRLRGSGLAQALFAAAVTETRVQGGTSFRLWTDTRFHSGHCFYEKLGFKRLPVVRYLADSTDAWEYAYALDRLP